MITSKIKLHCSILHTDAQYSISEVNGGRRKAESLPRAPDALGSALDMVFISGLLSLYSAMLFADSMLHGVQMPHYLIGHMSKRFIMYWAVCAVV